MASISEFTVSPKIDGKAGKIVRPSKEALDNAVIREICTGEEYKRKLGERKREQQAAKEAAQMKGHRTIGELGKCVMNIPGIEFFALVHKYGWEEVYSDEFAKYVFKTHRHLCPNRI